MSLYDKILGHEEIIERLKTMAGSGKVSQAYIFCGADGSGKNLLATAYAQTLLCEHDIAEGCGVCRFCKQVESGNNPDLTWVQRADGSNGSIGVDVVREQLVEDIMIKPYNGRRKVYIIDNSENLTVEAQNALLKTIEEPPEYGVIMLLTNNLDALLPTIISRCMVLNLKPIREGRIAEYLISNYHIPDYEAKVCAAFSQGCLGRAISLVTTNEFAKIRDDVLRLVKNVYTYDISDIIDEIAKVQDYKVTICDYIDMMEMWYRDVLLFKVTKDPNALIFRDEIKAIREIAQKCSYEGVETILEGCEKAKQRLRANVNFDLAIKLMILTIKEN